MADPIVLVPLDGSKPALCAVPIARRLAELENASVRILHTSAADRSPAETGVSLGLAPADLTGVTLEASSGSLAAATVAAAAERGARLIVTCVQAGNVAPDSVIDAATLAVLRGAPCPVVLVNATRPLDGWTLRRVLAPHDGSPAVSDALKPATELVRAAGAELLVLQVAAEARALEPGSIAPPMYVDQVQHSWPAWSGEFLQRLACGCRSADLRVRLLVAHGEPATEAIRVAGEESVDLIVLAWRGLNPHAAMLKALLPAAPCPIMVTRVPA